MLKIFNHGVWSSISNYQNYFIDMDEDGNQTMQFDVPLDEHYYEIHLESMIEDDYNAWLVKGINQMTSTASILCELNMDDWYQSFYLQTVNVSQFQTKTIVDVLNYIKPVKWSIHNTCNRLTRCTMDMEKCTAYDVLMEAKKLYDVQYDIDTLHKCITIIDPYEIIDTGVYITPELNMKSMNYKGDSKSIVTRLYCYGKDDLTFASINDGKPYIENADYKDGQILASSWSDSKYINAESLLEAGRKKLKEMSVPSGSYTVDVIDLSAIDERYADLKFSLRSSVHCMLEPNKDMIHRVIKKRIYPDYPSDNQITLSNQPRMMEKEWNALSEKVETVRKEGVRYESKITQTNQSIESVVEKTEENTNRLNSVESKITPEELLVNVSESINQGNQLQTTSFVVDKEGIAVKNGGIKVYDAKNDLVMFVDDETKKLVFQGDVTGGSITGNTEINVGTDLYVGDNIILGHKNNQFDRRKMIKFGETSLLEFWKFQLRMEVLNSSITLNNGLETVPNSVGIALCSDYVLALESAGKNAAEDRALIQVGPSPEDHKRCISIHSYGGRVSLRGDEITANRAITVSSDQRLKSNLNDVDLSDIYKHINVKQFCYKDSNNRTSGVIAQDFIGCENEDMIIHKNEEGYLNVDYQVILMALIQKVNQLEEKIINMKEGER